MSNSTTKPLTTEEKDMLMELAAIGVVGAVNCKENECMYPPSSLFCVFILIHSYSTVDPCLDHQISTRACPAMAMLVEFSCICLLLGSNIVFNHVVPLRNLVKSTLEILLIKKPCLIGLCIFCWGKRFG